MRRRCTGGAASTIGDEVDLSLAKSFSSFISLCLQEDDIEDEHCLQWEHPSMLCVGWGFQSWKFSLLIPRKQWPQCSKNAIACMALSTTSRLSRKSYKEQVGALFILPIFKYPLVLSLFYPFKYPLADRTFLWQDFRALHSALNVRLVGRRADGNLTRKAKLWRMSKILREEEPMLVVLENVPGFVRKSRPGSGSPTTVLKVESWIQLPSFFHS